MSFKSVVIAAAAALTLATGAFAGETISVQDPYARSAMANAKSGAVFLSLKNTGTEDDRLIGARSDVAKKVELHTNKEDASGIMRMTPIEGGIALPAGGEHLLKRGGDHIMLMGLKEGLKQGEKISVTLIFEKAGEMQIEVPVDLER